MDLELQNIKQKTSALIRAYIGYYPISSQTGNGLSF